MSASDTALVRMSSGVLSRGWAFLFFALAEGPGIGDVPLLFEKLTIMSSGDVSLDGSGGSGTAEQSIGGGQAAWEATTEGRVSGAGKFGVI